MKIDGVFSGGGVKALSIIGALESAEAHHMSFSRLAGTSGGAIMAALVMAGYTSHELKKLAFHLDFKAFLDKPSFLLPGTLVRWLQLYQRLGLYKGDHLEEVLEGLLKKKGVQTFQDLPEGSLKIVVSDISDGRLVVLPDDLRKYGMIPSRFSVARAARISSSIPYFFEPVPIYTPNGDKHYFVDGGLLSNFPFWLFQRKEGRLRRPVVGVKLSSKMENMPAKDIRNAIDLYQALFETMREAHDARYVSKKDAKHVIFIPVEDVKTTDFSISDDMKETLITLGRERADHYFDKHFM